MPTGDRTGSNKGGRPRIYADAAARQRAWRARQKDTTEGQLRDQLAQLRGELRSVRATLGAERRAHRATKTDHRVAVAEWVTERAELQAAATRARAKTANPDRSPSSDKTDTTRGAPSGPSRQQRRQAARKQHRRS